MHVFKILTVMIIISQYSYAERVTAYSPNKYVPHFYEFDKDPQENPNGHYWCGQAALKTILAHRTGKTHSLSHIHKTLLANNGKPGTTGWYSEADPYCDKSKRYKFCSVLEDLVYAARYNYGMPNAKIYTISKGLTDIEAKRQIFTILRNAHKQNKLAMAFARTDMTTSTWGHAWVIIGYNTDGVTNPNNDPSNVYLFFRDVVQKYKTSDEMDDWYTLDTFYKSLKSNSSPNAADYKIAVF